MEVTTLPKSWELRQNSFQTHFWQPKVMSLKILAATFSSCKIDHGPRGGQAAPVINLGCFYWDSQNFLEKLLPKAAEWQEDDWVQALAKCQSFQKQLKLRPKMVNKWAYIYISLYSLYR